MNAIPLFCRTLVVIAIAGALYGCGGGGDDDSFTVPPPNDGPAVGTGVFKDSNVSGLSWSSGTRSGVTGPDGGFSFGNGQQVTFKVGGLTLGSGTGGDVMTPISLVAGGSSSSPAVINMTRFLMMLDQDGDPDNGLTISANVQNRAANWSSTNFADAGFDAVAATLAADARSADGGVHTIPDQTAARTHLEGTVRCAASGLFRGTFSGAQQGRFGVIIDPNTGDLFGLGALSGQPGNFDIVKVTPLTLDQQMSVSARSDVTGATFTGRLQGPDTLSGNWALTGSGGGTFSGSRLNARRDAVFRYSGFFNDPALPESGPITFDVNGAGEVKGVAYGTLRDQLIDFSGILTQGGVLTATGSNGAAINATSLIVLQGRFLQGTWRGTGEAGSFSGMGCKLN